MPATQLVFPEIECSPVVSRPVLALVAQSSDEGCTGNEKRKGRAARHSDSAARKAAYRAAKARVDYPDKPEIIAKLRETAAELGLLGNELLQSMVRFAECNRNWKQVGLYGALRDGALQ